MAESIIDFLEPVNTSEISLDNSFREGQIGRKIQVYENEFPDLDEADIVFVGCTEQRGAALLHASQAANAIRSEFYNLYYWHQDIRLADIGNIKNRQGYDRYICCAESGGT